MSAIPNWETNCPCNPHNINQIKNYIQWPTQSCPKAPNDITSDMSTFPIFRFITLQSLINNQQTLWLHAHLIGVDNDTSLALNPVMFGCAIVEIHISC